MQKKSNMKRWPLYTAGAVLLVLLGGYFWAQSKVKNILHEKAVASGIFQYQKSDVSLLRGDIVFEGAILNYHLTGQGRSLQITSPKICIEGISWLKLISSKTLKINDFRLVSPIITIKASPETNSLSPLADTTSSESLVSLGIEHIQITEGAFRFFENEHDSLAKISVDTFNMDFSGAHFSKNTNGGNPTIEDAFCSLHGLSMRIEKDLQRVSAEQISFNKRDSLIEILGMRVAPQFDKRAFFQRLKYRKARLDFDFPTIKVVGWHFDKIMDQALVARKVEVPDMLLQVLVNQNLQPDPHGYKPLPQEALTQAPFSISLDSIVAEDGRLFIEVVGPGKTESGSLNFEPIKGHFANVTNDSARIAQSNLMEVRAVGWINGRHRVSNHFWIDLASSVHAFTFKGNLSEMPFSGLNSFIRPWANVRFDGGQIDQMDFEVNADKYRAQGNLNIEYDNLDFAILDEDRKEKKLFSKLVNLLFVNKENIRGGESFREGNIYVKRDTTRTFFAYCWEAIQSGIKTSLLNKFALKKADKKQKTAKKR